MPYDPKHIVTPYAFEVDDQLLGQPIAVPRRRMAAILIDLVIASLLSSLGFMILLLFTAIYCLAMAVRKAGRERYRKRTRFAFAATGTVLGLVFLTNVFVTSAFFMESVSDEVMPAIEAELMAEADSLHADSTETDTAVAGPIPSMTITEAENDPLVLLQADHNRLQEQYELLEEEYDDLEDDFEDYREEMEEASLVRMVQAAANDLGLAFGWFGIYVIIALTWWNGRTIGKRIMRIRVVTLSGKKLTLWHSFERFGGYAAGFATGLLGFLQVYWDANRQAIHDKIAGTVVVDTRKDRITGDEEG